MLVPALTGDFGVMPGHVPTIAQLRPGVVTVHKTLDKEIEKYFVSSGFAFVHADSSTDVCAIEAVKLEDLDPEAVRSGLQVNNILAAASPEISAFRGSACVAQYRLLQDMPPHISIHANSTVAVLFAIFCFILYMVLNGLDTLLHLSLWTQHEPPSRLGCSTTLCRR